MPRWLPAKRVVVYGIVHSVRDHRDYAIIGEWEFTLYDRLTLPTVEAPIVIRRTKKGRYSKRGTAKSTRVQYRDPTTGKFTKAPLTGPKVGAIPDDDTIVADTLRIVEEVTGHRMFRTPGQQEAGLDRIGIQSLNIGLEDLKKTYTYDEYLRELRRRAESEWRNR